MTARTAIAAVILLIAACSPSTEPNDAATQTFDEIVASSLAVAEAQRTTRDDTILQCLLDQGFDPDQARAAMGGYEGHTSPAGSELATGLTTDADIAATIGYGFAPVAVFTRDRSPGEESSSGDSGEGFDSAGLIRAALSECNTQLLGDNYHPPALIDLAVLTDELEQRVIVDPRVLASQSQWSLCMTEYGIADVQNVDQLIAATQIAFEAMNTKDRLPLDIAALGLSDDAFEHARSTAASIYGNAQSWDELAELETATASVDIACREEADIESVTSTVRDEILLEERSN